MDEVEAIVDVCVFREDVVQEEQLSGKERLVPLVEGPDTGKERR